jgi:hypothetical protein
MNLLLSLFSTLKTEAAGSLETSVSIYHITRCHMPQHEQLMFLDWLVCDVCRARDSRVGAGAHELVPFLLVLSAEAAIVGRDVRGGGCAWRGTTWRQSSEATTILSLMERSPS